MQQANGSKDEDENGALAMQRTQPNQSMYWRALDGRLVASRLLQGKLN